MRRIVGRLGCADGAEIAEAALVLPVVFTFLLGIIWFGRAFNIYATITQAAQRGAVTAARPVCATCPAPASSWNGFPGDAAVENSVFSVMRASSLDPVQVTASGITFPACLAPPAPPGGGCVTTANNITICRSVLLNPSSSVFPQPPQCGIVVSFQYPFQFVFPFTSLSMQPIILRAEARSRMEN